MSLPDDEIRNPDDIPAPDAAGDESTEQPSISASDREADTSKDRSLEPDAVVDETAGGGAPLGDDADFVPPGEPDETLDFAAPADMESGIGFQAMGAEAEGEADRPAGDELLPDFAAGTDEFGAERAEEEADEPGQKAEQKPKKKSGQRFKGVLAALGKSDPYTVLMGLALLALIVGTLFFYFELSAYNFDIGAGRAN